MLLTTTAWAQQQPVGSVEITGGPFSIYVKGWAYDPDDEAAAITVRVEVYNDAECTGEPNKTETLTANQTTTGIAGNHGFEGYITTGGDNKWVMVYAVDATDGDMQLGSKTQVLIKYLNVGGALVTPDNTDDVFGASSGISFDNATNTLTLTPQEFGINPNPNDGTMITANFDLTIAGTYHMTKDMLKIWSNYDDTPFLQFVDCDGSLTFNGDFTLLRFPTTDYVPSGAPVLSSVVKAGGNITLSGGTLVVASFYNQALQAGGALIVGSGFNRLEMKAKYTSYEGERAMTAQSLSLADGFTIVTPEGGSFNSTAQTIMEPDGTTRAYHIVIANTTTAAQPTVLDDWPLEQATYPLYLGSKQVTFLNCDDIFDDATDTEPASATFKPSTQTLTLNNPTISGSIYDAKIYTTYEDLTIKGSYHMAKADTPYGIRLNPASVTLDGDFTIRGNDRGINGYDNLSNPRGNVTLKSGHLTIVGGDDGAFGIRCNHLIVQDGIDLVTITGNSSAIGADNITLGDNLVFKTSGGYDAKTVVIGRGSHVTFAKEGYSTYFNSRHDAVLAKGMKARIVTAKGDGGTLTYETIADGYVGTEEAALAETGVTAATVPAGTAVLLQREESTAVQDIVVDLVNKADMRDFTATNMLLGSDVATTTTGEGKHYKLSYSAGGTDIGWYWGADNGAAFTSGAHKAWLVLPAAGARDFLGLPDWEESTSLNEELRMKNEEFATAGEWFTLDGRRLDGKPTKAGLYINNGRKVVIK